MNLGLEGLLWFWRFVVRLMTCCGFEVMMMIDDMNYADDTLGAPTQTSLKKCGCPTHKSGLTGHTLLLLDWTADIYSCHATFCGAPNKQFVPHTQNPQEFKLKPNLRSRKFGVIV